MLDDKANFFADKVAGDAMALSYTNANFANELRTLGVDEQLISYIDEYSKSQWIQVGWANSRKKRPETAYDGQGKSGNIGENGRDSRTGSSQMGQQGLRTVPGSSQTDEGRKYFKSRVGTVRGWTKDGLNPDNISIYGPMRCRNTTLYYGTMLSPL